MTNPNEQPGRVGRQVLWPLDLWVRIVAAADAAGVPVAEWIRRTVRQHLDEETPQ